MEFFISKQRLLRALSKIQGIVDKSATLASLKDVLLEVEDNVLTVKATDLGTSFITTEEVEMINPGVVTTDARHLLEIVRELPEDKAIQFSCGENFWIKIAAGKALFQIGGGAHFEYPVIPHLELESLEYLTLKASNMIKAIDLTLHCAQSTDDARLELAGIHVVYNPQELHESKFIATDTHRLVYFKNDFICESTVKNPISFSIPKKSCYELKRTLETVNGEERVCCYFYNNNLIFKFDNNELRTFLLPNKFPPFERVIPYKNEFKVLTSKSLLIDALKRINLCSNENNKVFYCIIKSHSIVLNATNADFGTAMDEIPCFYDGVDSINITLNVRYVLEVLQKVSTEEIEIKVQNGSRPILIPDLNHQYLNVIMPLKTVKKD